MSTVEFPGPQGTVGPAAPWWTRALTEREWTRSEPPDWAEFIEKVLARAPVASMGNDLTSILHPLVTEAGERLAQRNSWPEVDFGLLRIDFQDRLGARLTRLAARTLVLELNVMRVTGRLAGKDPVERFADFVVQRSTPAGLAALFDEYAVLARILAQSCLRAVETLVELLDRLDVDQVRLVGSLLPAQPGALVAVETGAGDGHRGGRSVAILRFASGARVVYKPRSLAIDGIFARAVRWFSAGLGDELRLPRMVRRSGYGWVELIRYEPCVDRVDLERFYYRQGALLALLRALDGTDIHYENLIAHRDQPVLIDVETLFHPSLAPPGQDPAAHALTASVYRLALLPRMIIGDDAALDISGLGGDRDSRLPFDSAHWVNVGTDQMRLVRRPGTLAGAGNRPMLDGVEADPGEFTRQLVAGFVAGHTLIARSGHELVDLLLDAPGHEVRVVVRATRVYAELLDESTHPNLLRDATERDAFFAELRTDSAGDELRTGLVDDEISQLWNGDVPYFATRPGSVDLYSATGERFSDVLAEPGLTAVIRNLGAANEVDRADQEWIIRAAMATRAPANPHEVGTAVPVPVSVTAPDTERILAAATAIGDQIVARAYREDDRANWLGLELFDDRRWQLAPLGASFGTGYCGTALFLAQLADVTGITRYADVARQALGAVPDLLTALASEPEAPDIIGPGGFAGFGGISYALTQLSTLLGDAEIGDWARMAAQLTAMSVEAAADSGVFAGLAGGLAALVARYEATGEPAAWVAATRFAQRLREARLPSGYGFGHGAAGIGWALVRYAAAGGESSYAVAGLAALRRAATSADDAPAGELSWCRGVPGVALAVADSPGAMATPGLATLVGRTVGRLSGQPVLPSHCLCHGELGVLEFIGALGQVPIDRASVLLATLDHFGPRCGTPDGVPSPGLLTGLAGIGHGLLRLGFPAEIPSGLLLKTHGTNNPEGAHGG